MLVAQVVQTYAGIVTSFDTFVKTVEIWSVMKWNKIVYLVSFIILFAIIALSIQYITTPKAATVLPREIEYGVADSEKTFENKNNVAIEHSFIAWKRDDTLDLNTEIDKILVHKREPLITIEPWSFTQKGDTLFKDIVSGDYKSTIESMCKVADEKNVPMIFRWGHEMDYAGSSRYPWASKDTQGFIEAYQYWVGTCRNVLKNKKINFMWSPGGNEGLDKYYPDPQYVDSIGLSLYGYAEYEKKTLGYTQSFFDIFNQKYNRVKKFNKPIYLAELGVAGTDEYKEQWIKGMYKTIEDKQKYSLLYGLIYFQFGDAAPWVPGISAPDFRLKASLFPPQ